MVPAPGAVVRVKATVHAESDELAASVTLTKTTGKDGEPMLLFQYPVDRFDRFRYPARGQGQDNGVEYSGHKVKISGTEGALVYADLVVEVPKGVKKGRLETRAGAIDAEHLDGDLRLEHGERTHPPVAIERRPRGRHGLGRRDGPRRAGDVPL